MGEDNIFELAYLNAIFGKEVTKHLICTQKGIIVTNYQHIKLFPYKIFNSLENVKFSYASHQFQFFVIIIK